MEDKRSLPVDMLRGLRIWSMLINGNLIDKNLWWVGFSHGSWFQTTSSDLGYPMFLFVAGIAMHYSFKSPKNTSNSKYFLRLFWRSIRLIVLGVVLKAMPGFTSFSVMGTLQCIGYAVIISGVVICGIGQKFAAPVALALQVIGYVLTIQFADWPNRWAKDFTFFEKLDLQLIGHTGGMEGVCTTFFASSFVLLGFSLKDFVSSSSIVSKTSAGLVLMAVGLGLQYLPSEESALWIPIVPRLFTISFSIYTVGTAFLFFALFELLLKLPLKSIWENLLLPFGRNSILAYAGVIAFRKIFFDSCLISCTVEFPQFKSLLINEIAQVIGYQSAVYFYTSVFLFIAWAICLILHKRNIIVRI